MQGFVFQINFFLFVKVKAEQGFAGHLINLFFYFSTTGSVRVPCCSPDGGLHYQLHFMFFFLHQEDFNDALPLTPHTASPHPYGMYSANKGYFPPLFFLVGDGEAFAPSTTFFFVLSADGSKSF